MKKFYRVILVLAFTAVFVAFGTNGTTWASKLDVGNQVPASGVLNDDRPDKERPHGTVDHKPDCDDDDDGDGEDKHTIGSIATWNLKGKSDGKGHKACVDKDKGKHHPPKKNAHLLTSPIILTAESGNTLGVDQKVCFPVPPGKKGTAYYWNGKAWVKTEKAKNGQACVTVPANTPNHTFVALFDK